MIPVYEPFLDDNVRKYVLDCVESGWISSLGEYVGRFEGAFSRYCGVPHGVGTSNGTTALHLALKVLSVGPGDEVVVPGLTFVASANAVHYTGASPIFVDVDPKSWCMDLDDVRRKLTSRTRAIMAVHLYGHPVDVDPLMELARAHALWVVEDAAEAHGATYKGRRVGGLGHVGCFSFYGNKIITTGEGGMLVTADPHLAERAAFLRDHAMDPHRRYWHSEVGFNYRMTNIQAAIGCAQLERIEEILERKRRIAELYNQGLAGIPGLVLPSRAAWAGHVYWMYSVLVEDAFGMDRDRVIAALRDRGVDSRPFFVPLHELPPYRAGYDLHLPVAEALSRGGLNLPSGPRLSREQVAFICQMLRELQGAR